MFRSKKNLHERGPVGIDAAGRNQIARKGGVRSGVGHGNELAIEIERLGKISGAFQRRRNGHAAAAAALDGPIFLRPEEKQSVTILVEDLRDISGTADVVAPRVEAIARLGQSLLVVEKVVGVELFVPFEI